ncbi:hypothetical protein LZ023_37845 (plasmid) [Pseudomonas silvicola]|nr:hypothetical protein LZ023_37845 [Pseudomonas silvicola]
MRPGTDAAFILGVLSVLIEEQLTDEAFLSRYTVGWPEMVAYIRGEEDGTPCVMPPGQQSGVSAAFITDLPASYPVTCW